MQIDFNKHVDNLKEKKEQEPNTNIYEPLETKTQEIDEVNEFVSEVEEVEDNDNE